MHIAAVRTQLPFNMPAMGLFAIAGVLGYVGNLCGVRAVALAPNPGYAVAIFGLQALVVTLASVMLVGASVSWVKVLGVVLCFVGVVLLVID